MSARHRSPLLTHVPPWPGRMPTPSPRAAKRGKKGKKKRAPWSATAILKFGASRLPSHLVETVTETSAAAFLSPVSKHARMPKVRPRRLAWPPDPLARAAPPHALTALPHLRIPALTHPRTHARMHPRTHAPTHGTRHVALERPRACGAGVCLLGRRRSSSCSSSSISARRRCSASSPRATRAWSGSPRCAPSRLACSGEWLPGTLSRALITKTAKPFAHAAPTHHPLTHAPTHPRTTHAGRLG